MARRRQVRSLHLAWLAGLAAALLTGLFIQLAREMAEGERRAFDRAILHAMQALRDSHPWAAAVLRDLSGLGSTVVLTLCTTVTVGYLALVAARRMAGRVAVAVITGAAGISLLKAAFARLRPDAVFAEMVAPGAIAQPQRP